MIDRGDMVDALSALAERRPVFHSEADFQHELAWIIRELHPGIAPRLERPVELGDQRGHVDLWLHEGAANTVIELKYGTRKTAFVVDGEGYDLRDGAPDWFRYDIWKDAARTESLVDGGEANAGFVIALSNDHLLWNKGSREAISGAFSTHDGNEINGSLAWNPSAGPGSTRGRESPIELGGHYVTHWQPYSNPGSGSGGEFRCLVLDVGSALASATGRTSP